MSANDPNGILTVQDMAEKEYLKFYKDTKYWNMDLREEFMNETRGLWETTHADKRMGRLFQSSGATNSADFNLTMNKVNAEMAQAIKEHGKVEIPKTHIEEFYERINQEKKNVVARA
jgi:hypothetical protein